MVAVGVMVAAAGAGVLWHSLATAGTGTPGPVRIQATAPAAESWGFVLRADTAQVLRHRPGLEPAEFISTHAFGWDGLTIGEAVHDPALVKELRLRRTLSPVDLVRMEARGS
jgi:hypothetical protein